MVKAEGKYFEFEGEDQINPNFLETFSFESPDQYIKTETNEFSAVCPFSGLPDLARVKVEYYPTGSKCIELKSLKYYFVSYRNVGYGGALTAGLILSEFVPEGIPWAHLDIAGPARADKDNAENVEGGTGFGVRTLIKLIQSFEPPESE